MPEPQNAPAQKAAPRKPAEAAPPAKPKAEPAKPKVDLPDHKDDLAALAITHGVPSYEAWAMTVDDLRDLLTTRLGG